jgi:hypothetical protein
MIPLPCDTCLDEAVCLFRNDMARRWVYAWLADEPAECNDYDPAWFHGLEGVLR